jgi:hypothetical protein
MSLDLPLRSLSFSGHETFPVRHLWPKKGYDALCVNPECFSTDDAMVDMGVGKNMVRAIRHWGLCFGLWEEDSETRGRRLEVTPFGEALLADQGWDPFLEHAATLWWLHWRLVHNLDRCTTATWLFSRPRGGRFSRDEITSELEGLIIERRARRVPRPSLKRDVEVIVRCYARSKAAKTMTEDDTLDSPLCELQLVRPGVEKGTYELPVGPAATLPDELFAAALFEYGSMIRVGARTLPLQDVLYGPLSPGRVFRMTEDALSIRLTRLEAKGTIGFDETAGLRQVILPDDVPSTLELLADFYERSGSTP